MDGKQSQCMGVIFLLINKVKTLGLESDGGLVSSGSSGNLVSPPLTPKSKGSASGELEPLASPHKEPTPSVASPRKISDPTHLSIATGSNAPPTAGTKPLVGKKTHTATIGPQTTSPGSMKKRPVVPPRSKSVAASEASQNAVSTPSVAVVEEVPTDPEKRKEFYIIKLQAASRAYLARRAFAIRLKEQKQIMAKFVADPKLVKKLVRLQATVRGMIERNKPILRARRKRNEIVKEILTTEDKYVKSLTTLVTVYMKALEGLGETVLPAVKIRSIFSEIKVIMNYNQVIFNLLKKRLESWYENGQTLGDIFLKFTDFLKVYTAYVNNYNESMSTMQDLMMNNPSFVDTVTACREDPRVSGMEMSSYLIMPIQRIPRYVLLLSDLFKNTPEHHKDHVPLKDALSKMEGVASYVNKKKREAENLLGVTTVARHLVGLESPAEFNQPHRRYVRQGFLQEADAGNLTAKSLKTRYLFLFNDILVGTKEATGVLSKSKVPTTGFDIDTLRNSDAQFKYLYSFQLLGALIHDIPEQNKISFTFELVEAGSGRKLMLVAPSQQVKDEWIQDLDEMIMSCLEKHRSRIGVPLSEERTELPADLKTQSLTGTLFKRSESGTWKKRYFILTQDVLTFYPDILSSVDSMVAPKTIPLIFAGVFHVPLMDRPFCLRLFTKDRVYVLSAETAHERLQWVNMIRSAISKRLAEIDIKLKANNSINATFSHHGPGANSLIGGALATTTQTSNESPLRGGGRDKHGSVSGDAENGSTGPAQSNGGSSSELSTLIAGVLGTAGSTGGSAPGSTTISPAGSPAPASESKRRKSKTDKTGTIKKKSKDSSAAATESESAPPAAVSTASTDDSTASTATSSAAGDDTNPADATSEPGSGGRKAGKTGTLKKEKGRKKKLKRDQTISKITKTGEIWKFSSGSSKVVKQKMVLKNGEIQLFKTGKTKPVTNLDLLLVQTPSTHIESTTVKDVTVFQFTLVSSDRKYVLGAESEEEAQSWIEHVQLAHEALGQQ